MKTTTPMTKPPRAVAQEAIRLAQDALPAYSAPRSRKDFTQHQLFAILALKTFFKTDYRGIAPLLDPVLRGRPAAKKGEVVVLLLRATTTATDRGLIGETPTAAVDGTGLG